MIALFAAWALNVGIQEEDADQKKRWTGDVDRLSARKPLKFLIAETDRVVDVDLKEVAAFWDAARALKVLKGPACKCPPRPTAQFILLVDDFATVSIQIVSKHWFKGTVLAGGHSTDFYFLDPKDRLPELAAKLLAPPKAKTMCETCAGKAYIMMTGTCAVCGGMTESAGYKMCDACALKKGVCQVCEKPLKK